MFSLSDAIAGAAIALCVVLVSQLVAMIQSRLERENRKHVLLRTKYEELGLCFLESMMLPAKMLLCTTQEETLAVTHQIDGNKMHLLALVYFPRLREATGKYIETYSNLCEGALSLYNPEDSRPLGMQVVKRDIYIAASNAHFEAKGYLHDQIEKYADLYVKA